MNFTLGKRKDREPTDIVAADSPWYAFFNAHVGKDIIPKDVSRKSESYSSWNLAICIDKELDAQFVKDNISSFFPEAGAIQKLCNEKQGIKRIIAYTLDRCMPSEGPLRKQFILYLRYELADNLVVPRNTYDVLAKAFRSVIEKLVDPGTPTSKPRRSYNLHNEYKHDQQTLFYCENNVSQRVSELYMDADGEQVHNLNVEQIGISLADTVKKSRDITHLFVLLLRQILLVIYPNVIIKNVEGFSAFGKFKDIEQIYHFCAPLTKKPKIGLPLPTNNTYAMYQNCLIQLRDVQTFVTCLIREIRFIVESNKNLPEMERYLAELPGVVMELKMEELDAVVNEMIDRANSGNQRISNLLKQKKIAFNMHAYVRVLQTIGHGFTGHRKMMPWGPLNIGYYYMRNLTGSSILAADSIFVNQIRKDIRRTNIIFSGPTECGKSKFIHALKDKIGGEMYNLHSPSTFVSDDITRATVLFADEFQDPSTYNAGRLEVMNQFFDVGSCMPTEQKHKSAQRNLQYVPWLIATNHDVEGSQNSTVDPKSFAAFKTRFNFYNWEAPDKCGEMKNYQCQSVSQGSGDASDDIFQYFMAMIPFKMSNKGYYYLCDKIASYSVQALFETLLNPFFFKICVDMKFIRRSAGGMKIDGTFKQQIKECLCSTSEDLQEGIKEDDLGFEDSKIVKQIMKASVSPKDKMYAWVKILSDSSNMGMWERVKTPKKQILALLMDEYDLIDNQEVKEMFTAQLKNLDRQGTWD